VTSFCADDWVRQARPQAVRPVRPLLLGNGERIVPERDRFSLDATIVIKYPGLFTPVRGASKQTLQTHRRMVESAACSRAPDPEAEDRALGWGESRQRRPLRLPLRLP